MTTKTIDSKGRLALGSAFAGRLVLVDETDPNKIIITLARAIPEEEAWLYQNEEALALVRHGLAQAPRAASARRRPTLTPTPPWRRNSRISDPRLDRLTPRAVRQGRLRFFRLSGHILPCSRSIGSTRPPTNTPN